MEKFPICKNWLRRQKEKSQVFQPSLCWLMAIAWQTLQTDSEWSMAPMSRFCSSPNLQSEIIGYVRGSVLDSYKAYRVWGQAYESDGRQARNINYSPEIGKASGCQLTTYRCTKKQRQACMCHEPMKLALSRKWVVIWLKISIVVKFKRGMAEKALQQLSSGLVLGDSTESASVTGASDETASTVSANLVSVVLDNTATNSATEQNLLESIIAESQGNTATQSSAQPLPMSRRPAAKNCLFLLVSQSAQTWAAKTSSVRKFNCSTFRALVWFRGSMAEC